MNCTLEMHEVKMLDEKTMLSIEGEAPEAPGFLYKGVIRGQRTNTHLLFNFYFYLFIFLFLFFSFFFLLKNQNSD